MEQALAVSATPSATLPATFCTAKPISPKIGPYSRYQEFVVNGAIQCDQPASYISELKAVDDLDDPDKARQAIKYAILQSHAAS